MFIIEEAAWEEEIGCTYFTDSNYYVPEVSMQLVEEAKEKEMKSEGCGLGEKSEGEGIGVTKGWAVEVNGELHPLLLFTSRKEAREFRNLNAELGHKAHVRRTEVKVLKHKV